MLTMPRKVPAETINGSTGTMMRTVGITKGTMIEAAVEITSGGFIPTGDIAMKSIVGEEGMNLAEAIPVRMITEESTTVVVEDTTILTTVGGETPTVAEDTAVVTEALAVVQLYHRVMICTRKCGDENEQMLQPEGINP